MEPRPRMAWGGIIGISALNVFERKEQMHRTNRVAQFVCCFVAQIVGICAQNVWSPCAQYFEVRSTTTTRYDSCFNSLVKLLSGSKDQNSI